MEQNIEPINKCTHLWPINFRQRKQEYTMDKFLQQVVLRNLDSLMFVFVVVVVVIVVCLFWLHSTACETLIPRPRVKALPPAIEEWRVNHWASRKVPWTATCKSMKLKYSLTP